MVALATRIDETPDPDAVTHREFTHLSADGGHGSGNLVSRDEWIIRLAEFAARAADIGVADAGVRNVDQYIRRADVPSLDLGRFERRTGCSRGAGVDKHHLTFLFAIADHCVAEADRI